MGFIRDAGYVTAGLLAKAIGFEAPNTGAKESIALRERIPMHGQWSRRQHPDDRQLERGYAHYRRVALREAEVANALDELILEAIGDEYLVQPGFDDDKSADIAETCQGMFDALGGDEFNGGNVYQTMQSFMRSVLYRGYVDGLYIGEPVWYRDRQGRVMLDHVKEKDPELFTPDTDAYGNIRRLIYRFEGAETIVDPNHLIIWSFDQAFQNFYGQSKLRRVNRAAYMLDLVWRLIGIKASKESYGQPVGKMPHSQWQNTSMRNDFKTALQQLTTEGVIVISQEFDLDTFDVTNAQGLKMLTDIRTACINEIRIGLMGQSLATGDSQHSTRAASQIHENRITNRGKWDRSQLVSVIQRQVVRKWCDYNYNTDAADYKYCQFVIPKDEQIDVETEIKKFAFLWEVGLDLSKDQLRETFNAQPPTDEDDAVVKPRGPTPTDDGPGVSPAVVRGGDGDLIRMAAPSSKARATAKRLDEIENNGILAVSAVMASVKASIQKRLKARYAKMGFGDIAGIVSFNKGDQAALAREMKHVMKVAGDFGTEQAREAIERHRKRAGDPPANFAAYRPGQWSDADYVKDLMEFWREQYSSVFTADVQADLARLIAQGMTAGDSLEAMMSSLSKKFEEMIARGDLSTDWLKASRVERLVRTAACRGWQGMKFHEMEKTAGVIGYEYSAVLDYRTTETCQILDGKTWRKDDPKRLIFVPPNHWGERSEMLEVWWDSVDWENPPPASAKPAAGFGG